MSMNDFNSDVINEFRANNGKVGGGFEGASMVLVHHSGARSGIERVTPLVYRPEGDGWVIYASKAGAPDNPDWYHNLKAHPATTIEVGSERVDVTAVRGVRGQHRPDHPGHPVRTPLAVLCGPGQDSTSATQCFLALGRHKRDGGGGATVGG